MDKNMTSKNMLILRLNMMKFLIILKKEMKGLEFYMNVHMKNY